MAVNKKNDVAAPRREYGAMVEDWKLIRALMGGTKAMRLEGETYLPKEEGETDRAYRNRLKRTYLYNFFKKTVEALTGKPFSKPVRRPEKLETEIDEILNDVDLRGNDLTMFAKSVFEDSLQMGLSHILIDYPRTLSEDDYKKTTVLDERVMKLRPYWVHIKAENVIGWKEIFVNGVHMLKQIRIRTCVYKPDGDYAETEVDQIRVINYDPTGVENPVSFEIYEYNKTAGEWLVVDQGTYKGIQRIPLVTYYTNQRGFMVAEPPLLDLAYLNLSHYQKESDYNNIVHVIQVPILVGIGWDSNKTPSLKQIGPNRMLTMSNTDADLKYVEHTGAAANVGREAIEALEDKMMKLSIRLLSEKTPGGVTATEAVLDTESAESALKSMVTSLAVALKAAGEFTYQWMGKEQPEGDTYTPNSDFGLMIGNDFIAQWLLKANVQGILSKKTVGNEAKRVGYISEEVDIEDEIEIASEEAMAAFENAQSQFEDNTVPGGEDTVEGGSNPKNRFPRFGG